MDLSVIIVNWNSATFLQKCLRSIYQNERHLQFEVLVVDNGSFDGSGEIVAQECLAAKFVESKENVGFAKANNLGFAHSSGRNLLFLNPDTEIVGSALEEMVRLLDSRAGAAVAGCRLLNSDFTVQTSCIQRFPTILNQSLDSEYLQSTFPNAKLWGIRSIYDLSQNPAVVDVVSGACLMIKRHVFEQVGQFSTNYFMYAEDTDLCFKVKEAGWEVLFLNQVEVIHHGGRSSEMLPNHLATVMMRQSLREFMRLRRGWFYAIAYQSVMAAVAVFRLLALGLLFLLTLGQFRRDGIRNACQRWVKVLRWSVGLEASVRQTI